jgi:3-isopropylmalate/(R)-2-methylmalate dehydratase large subunit
MSKPRTLFEKIWDRHQIIQEPGAPAILYIDLHLVHEVTSPQAFEGLRQKGLHVRRPERTVATMDHSIPTTGLDLPILDVLADRQLKQLQTNCKEFGISLYDMESDQRGIVHVIDPTWNDHCLRRQPYRHTWRVWRAGLRHWHQRG